MENIIYYLSLFALVFVVRIFKLKKEFKKDFNANKYKILHVSLDLIYTASGIVIALLLNLDSKWVSAVFIIYIIFVISSSQLEMASSDEFSDKSKTWIHGIIVVLIITFSIITYLFIIPSVNKDAEELKVGKKEIYFVLIPYSDESLEKHVGKNELKKRRFMYYTEQIGDNIDSLKSNALKDLRKTISPLYKDYNLGITIYTEDIKISPLNE